MLSHRKKIQFKSGKTEEGGAEKIELAGGVSMSLDGLEESDGGTEQKTERPEEGHQVQGDHAGSPANESAAESGEFREVSSGTSRGESTGSSSPAAVAEAAINVAITAQVSSRPARAGGDDSRGQVLSGSENSQGQPEVAGSGFHVRQAKDKFNKALKRTKLPKNMPDVAIPENKYKNKAKSFYESEIDAIARSYKATVSEDLESYKFGKIVDWGDIDVRAIAERLIMLGEKMCDILLFPYQREYALRAFESILLNDGEEITALFSRQSGKSTTIAMVSATCMVVLPVMAAFFPQLAQFERGVMIGVFAPTESQAQTIGDNIHRFLKNEKAQAVLGDPEIGMYYSDYTVMNASSTSFVRVQSAAPAAKVESKTYHIIIIDEAQDVTEDKILRSIHPMGASTSASIFKIGTPIPQHCELYEAILRNKRLIYDSKRKIRNHFEYDYKVVIKYNERYKKFIEKEIRRYGADSDYFRMSYGLEWLLDKGMALTLDKFETHLRYPEARFEYQGRDSAAYVAGLDLAKKFDSTVLTILRLERRLKVPAHFNTDDFTESDYFRKVVVNWWEFDGTGWEDQIDGIISVIREFPTLLNLAVDTTGVGDPIHEILSRRLQNRDVSVDSVVFSQKSKHMLANTFYSNLKHDNIKIPSHQSARKSKRWEKFYQQMLAAEKRWSGNYMYISHPEVSGAKDDYVQSLLLGLHAADLALNGGNVQVGENFMLSRALGEEDESRSDILEGRQYDAGEISGFQNLRSLARQGRINFK